MSLCSLAVSLYSLEQSIEQSIEVSCEPIQLLEQSIELLKVNGIALEKRPIINFWNFVIFQF